MLLFWLARSAVHVRLSRHQHQERVTSDGHVAADVRPLSYQGYNTIFPAFSPSCSRRDPGSAMAISRNLGRPHRPCFRLFAAVAPPGSTNIPLTVGRDHTRHYDHRGGGGPERAGDLSGPHERPRQARCGSRPERRIRPDAGAEPCRGTLMKLAASSFTLA